MEQLALGGKRSWQGAETGCRVTADPKNVPPIAGWPGLLRMLLLLPDLPVSCQTL